TAALQYRIRRLPGRTVYPVDDRARPAGAAGFLYLASFATAGIAFARLNWRNSALGFWFNAVVLVIGRYSVHLVRTSSWFRASVARDCRSASVDRRLGLHRNRSGADVRHSQWGEIRKVRVLTRRHEGVDPSRTEFHFSVNRRQRHGENL